jgi:MinD superfamily P-loop ATPase
MDQVQELVVISGKGGTGKTSLVASFAVLVERAVVADCDVDAADLHLVLAPTIVRREEFSGGSQARIEPDRCTACGRCETLCRFNAIRVDDSLDTRGRKVRRVDPIACEGCGVCAWFCEPKAIQFGPVVNGDWFVSETRCGPMVHARLEPAAANSGKLVSVVRREAKKVAAQRELELILIDGSPGIGCPVIASITGADLVLAVVEPTQSGMHDLGRIIELTAHFQIETLVAINKWDINPDICRQIEQQVARHDVPVIGRIRYDRAVTEAQAQGLSTVEYTDGAVAEDIRQTWRIVSQALDQNKQNRQLNLLYY